MRETEELACNVAVMNVGGIYAWYPGKAEAVLMWDGKVIVENTDSAMTAQCRKMLGAEPLIREGGLPDRQISSV